LLAVVGELISECFCLNMLCEFQENSFWFYIGTAEECSVKNFVVTKPDEVLNFINGENSNQFDHDDVKMLNIQSQTVNFMPDELEDFLPNLQGIRVAHCGLKSVEKSNFEAFKDLKHLYLNDNDLETLDSDLFEANVELKVIDFTNNKLKIVGENILEPLVKLDVAHFQNNNCINSVAWKSKLAQLKTEMKEKCSSPEKELERAKVEIAKLKIKVNTLESKLQTCNKKQAKPKGNKN
jgi:Leucine-rich repeat (LRR) protein